MASSPLHSVVPLCTLLLGVIALSLPSSSSAEEKPLSQGLQCDGCVAVLQELHGKLKSSQGRKRAVEAALNGLCTTDNFVVYRHSPPKMLKACNFILENYRDDLESSLHSFYKKYKVKDNLKLQAEFCDETIKVCLPGQRDTDIRMNPVGMNIDEANQKLSEDLGLKQETVHESSRDEL